MKEHFTGATSSEGTGCIICHRAFQALEIHSLSFQMSCHCDQRDLCARGLQSPKGKVKSVNIKYEISTTHFDGSLTLISPAGLGRWVYFAQKDREREQVSECQLWQKWEVSCTPSQLNSRFENRSSTVSSVKVWTLAVVITLVLQLFWLLRG